MATTPVDTLAGIRIIDCDAHITEPANLWESRVPATLRSKVPVQRTLNGVSAWYLDDEVWAGIGGNTIRRGHGKVLGTHIVQPFDDVDPAAWDVTSRLALLDEMGVWPQILYPNGVGFSSNHIFAIDDVNQRKLGPSKLIEDIGVNNILIETDIPHPTCLYPGGREHFADVLSALDEHTRRRVLQDNAAELYRSALPDA